MSEACVFEPLDAANASEASRLLVESLREGWSASALVDSLASGAFGALARLEDAEREAVGAVACRMAADEVEILQVVVRPAHRRLGLGRRLLRRGLAMGIERGARRAALEVRAGNAPARRLYEAEGFIEAQRRPGGYPDGEDAVVMLRELSFPPPV